MGVIKRMLKRTSRKIFSKIIPPGQANQLVLNHPALEVTGMQQAQTSKSAALQRKYRKQSKKHNSAVAEALMLAAKNYLPPVQFHHVHGPNVQLSKNKCVARRTQSFCQALVFSNRVILPNERVYIKVLDIAKGWSGTIRFGFTAVDPATLAYRMPKHACPDMTNAGHTWARALADEIVKRNSVIHFSYNKNGLIHYGINNQDCGIFHANANTNQNLWFIVDIYGLTAAVELIDPRVHNATSEIDFSQLDDELGIGGIGDQSTMFKSTSAMDDIFGGYGSRTKRRRARKSSRQVAALLSGAQWPHMDGQEVLANQLRLSLAQQHQQQQHQHQMNAQHLPNLNSQILPTAQQNIYSPMPLPAVQQTMMTSQTSNQSTRSVRDESHDYHHITTSENYHPIRGLSKLPRASAAAATTNTSALNQSLPASGGVVVDHSTPTREIYTRASQPTSSTSTSTDEQDLCHQMSGIRMGQQAKSSKSTKAPSTTSIAQQTPVAAARRTRTTTMVQNSPNQTQPTNTKRTPEHTSTKDTAKLISGHHRVVGSSSKPQASSSLAAHGSSPTTTTTTSTMNSKPKARHSSGKSQSKSPLANSNRDNNNNNNGSPSKDCPICFERPINCVLYQCGHMCTCYECGVKQWKTQSRTCPICRTIIKDVIKTYMS